MQVWILKLLITAIGNDNSRNPEFSHGQNGRGLMTMFPHLEKFGSDLQIPPLTKGGINLRRSPKFWIKSPD